MVVIIAAASATASASAPPPAPAQPLRSMLPVVSCFLLSIYERITIIHTTTTCLCRGVQDGGCGRGGGGTTTTTTTTTCCSSCCCCRLLLPLLEDGLQLLLQLSVSPCLCYIRQMMPRPHLLCGRTTRI